MEKLKSTPLWVDWLIARQLSDAVRKGGVDFNKTHSIVNENAMVKTIAWGKGDDNTRSIPSTRTNPTGGGSQR